MQEYEFLIIGALVSIVVVCMGVYMHYKRWQRRQCQRQGQPRRIYGASPPYEAFDLEAQAEAQALQSEEELANIGAWSEQETTRRHALDVERPPGALGMYPVPSTVSLSSMASMAQSASIEPFPAHRGVDQGHDGDEEEGDGNEGDERMEVAPQDHADMMLAFDNVAHWIVGPVGAAFLNTETGVAVMAIVDKATRK